ncbi:MAG: hypothetical protein ACT4QE_04030 [Anaerolineales bacterium]
MTDTPYYAEMGVHLPRSSAFAAALNVLMYLASLIAGLFGR